MPDIFFYEAFEEEQRLLKHYLPNNIQAGYTKLTIQEYGADIPPARIISTRVQSILPESWFDEVDGFLTRSTGYEHLHRYMKKYNKRVPAGHLPIYCHRAVAEHALMLWMSLLRRLPKQQQQMNTFNRDNITGSECQNKKLLVVGVGNIGSQIVQIGKGLQMNVRCVDLIHKFPEETYVEIEEGIKTADIIVCAMNLNETNFGYFNENLLRKVKPGVIFVNVSRGEISHSEILLKLVKEEHLGAVGLDTFHKEEHLAVALRNQEKSEDPEIQATLELMKLSNVICTPHNAFNTEESTDRKASQSVEQTIHFLEHGTFKWPIPELK